MVRTDDDVNLSISEPDKEERSTPKKSADAGILSTSKADLERAAELAVERAAEKAAERAVEKALTSGNSSTGTVTVKESYSNAQKTADEAAAPGSESTRSYDAKMYDRQYAYSPPGDYKVDDSAEAEELGISKESLNSSVENLEESEGGESVGSAESLGPADTSFESAEGGSVESEKPEVSAIPISNFDTPSTLDFGADFDPGFKGGDFGLKRSTETFSSSYSKPKDDFPPAKVDVDDHEDAEIFKMYADFGGTGWSSTKQKGWVRHRPLWDDSKRVNRDFIDDFGDVSAVETRAAGKKLPPTENQKVKLHKRMVDQQIDRSDQLAVPLATLSLDSRTPEALYQLLQREVKIPMTKNKYNNRVPVPMKVYVTIPVPYLPSYSAPKEYESKISHSTSKDSEPKSPYSIQNDYESKPSHDIQKNYELTSVYSVKKGSEVKSPYGIQSNYDTKAPYGPLTDTEAKPSYSIRKNYETKSLSSIQKNPVTKPSDSIRKDFEVKPTNSIQKGYEIKGIKSEPYELTISPKQLNDEVSA